MCLVCMSILFTNVACNLQPATCWREIDGVLGVTWAFRAQDFLFLFSPTTTHQPQLGAVRDNAQRTD